MNGIQENQKSQSAQNAKAHTGTKKKLTQKRLKELLKYDPETGIWTWKITVNNNYAKKNTLAGTIAYNGYRYIVIKRKHYLSARLAYFYMNGFPPEYDMDHIDRIRDNDNWNNLRHVSRQCNMRNINVPINNKSGVIGVVWYKRDKKWQAYIKVNQVQIFLGRFINKTDAIQARWEAEKKYGWSNCNSSTSAYLYLKEKGLVC